jgi:hypothetical protein
MSLGVCRRVKRLPAQIFGVKMGFQNSPSELPACANAVNARESVATRRPQAPKTRQSVATPRPSVDVRARLRREGERDALPPAPFRFIREQKRATREGRPVWFGLGQRISWANSSSVKGKPQRSRRSASIRARSSRSCGSRRIRFSSSFNGSKRKATRRVSRVEAVICWKIGG